MLVKSKKNFSMLQKYTEDVAICVKCELLVLA